MSILLVKLLDLFYRLGNENVAQTVLTVIYIELTLHAVIGTIIASPKATSRSGGLRWLGTLLLWDVDW